MRKLLILGSVIASTALLSACSMNNSLGNLPKANTNLAKEAWFKQVRLHVTKDLNQASKLNFDSSKIKEKTIMHVDVKPFDKVVVLGNFDVQIQGIQQQAVTVYGDNHQVRTIETKVKNHTLYIGTKQPNKLRMVVRIDVPHLESLVSHDDSPIIGRDLNSKHLTIINKGKGNIIFTGGANVRKIVVKSSGDVDALNALGYKTKIVDEGQGSINLKGHYNINQIDSSGSGDINVIGIRSAGLNIDSRGSGSIRLGGYSNLKSLSHTGSGDILAYWVDSQTIHINATGTGHIGLAGQTKKLYGRIGGNIRLNARYLNANYGDVKTYNSAHANVSVKKQLLATSINDSSIYFFGVTEHVMRYQQDDGIILPLWGKTHVSHPLKISAPKPKAHKAKVKAPHMNDAKKK